MGKLLHSDQQLLKDFAPLVCDLFNDEMVYQVGTSVSSDSYRDVDLRVMLTAKDFKTLQTLVDIDRLNMVVSLWGQKVTGLPIDFQVQDVEWANKKHNGVRSAVGIGGVAKGDGYDPNKPNKPRKD